MRTRVLCAAALLVAAFCLPAAAADLWFHVTVQEEGGDNANVTVNLPISIVEKALPLIPQDQMRDGRIVIDDQEFDAVKLRALWREVSTSPDMTYVTVKTDNENVKVSKEGGYLVARTVASNAGGAQVNARIPLAVVDALLSGEGNTLNVQAALAALVAEGEGELVTVNDDNSQVRVWIDSNPEAR
jgi:hypothetical protein